MYFTRETNTQRSLGVKLYVLQKKTANNQNLALGCIENESNYRYLTSVFKCSASNKIEEGSTPNCQWQIKYVL